MAFTWNPFGMAFLLWSSCNVSFHGLCRAWIMTQAQGPQPSQVSLLRPSLLCLGLFIVYSMCTLALVRHFKIAFCLKCLYVLQCIYTADASSPCLYVAFVSFYVYSHLYKCLRMLEPTACVHNSIYNMCLHVCVCLCARV